jgi:hypothetical protein
MFVLLTAHSAPFEVSQRAPSQASGGCGAWPSAAESAAASAASLPFPPSPSSANVGRGPPKKNTMKTMRMTFVRMPSAASTDLAREPAAMTQSPPLPKRVAGLWLAALAATVRVAAAETTPPPATPAPATAAPATPAPPPGEAAVDVVLRETPPPRRILSIEFNPLPLIIGKISFNAVIVPVDHHALVLAPFYVSTNTWPIVVVPDNAPAATLPQQTFSGFGGEIGYRYYTGLGGPRGFFAGPSFIIGAMTAKAQNRTSESYQDLGLALDVGYELLVMDSVALALGAGAQYSAPDKTIPSQQFPADVYANGKLMPRALASIGWAF